MKNKWVRDRRLYKYFRGRLGIAQEKAWYRLGRYPRLGRRKWFWLTR